MRDWGPRMRMYDIGSNGRLWTRIYFFLQTGLLEFQSTRWNRVDNLSLLPFFNNLSMISFTVSLSNSIRLSILAATTKFSSWGLLIFVRGIESSMTWSLVRSFLFFVHGTESSTISTTSSLLFFGRWNAWFGLRVKLNMYVVKGLFNLILTHNANLLSSTILFVQRKVSWKV